MKPLVRVLLVEEQQLIQDLLAECLVDGGLSVAVASHSSPAMGALVCHGADYSDLIIDVLLPGPFSGWVIAIKAREINPKLSVIYLTGGDTSEWSSKGVPGSLMLPKPFAMSQVITAVIQLTEAAGNPLPIESRSVVPIQPIHEVP